MVAFATREPTPEELENFRLVMSLVTRGYGAFNGGHGDIPVHPHWSWVERAYAAAFNGIHVPGAKAPFDVLCRVEEEEDTFIGIQIKTDGKWRGGINGERCLIEYNNENSRYLDVLGEHDITLDECIQENGVRRDAAEVGAAINEALQSYHDNAQENQTTGLPDGATIDLDNSVLVHVTWKWQNGDHNGPQDENDRYQYQIHSFSHLIQTDIWVWREPWVNANGGETQRVALMGYSNQVDETNDRAQYQQRNCIAQWYPTSRGQMKYYPLKNSARYRFEEWQTLEEQGDFNADGLVELAEELFG